MPVNRQKWITIAKKWSAGLALAAMLGGLGVGVAMIFIERSRPAQAPTAAPRSLPAPPPPSVPVPAEFAIGVAVTAQNCQPAAGCEYTYTIEPKYLGRHPLPATPFTVEYEVAGGDQPQRGSFTVQGGQAKIMKDVAVQGPPGAQLQARPVRVTG